MLWQIEGIDKRLTQDGEGYVYWRGAHVEHYSFREDDRENEIQAATELIQRCKHLERLSVPVTCGTAIWSWEWFAGLTPEEIQALPELARELITSHRDLYENDKGEFCWLESRPKEPEQYPYAVDGLFRVFSRAGLSGFTLKSDDLGGFYHPLNATGWRIAQMGQGKDSGCCYATTDQVLTWMRGKGVIG